MLEGQVPDWPRFFSPIPLKNGNISFSKISLWDFRKVAVSVILDREKGGIEGTRPSSIPMGKSEHFGRIGTHPEDVFRKKVQH